MKVEINKVWTVYSSPAGNTEKTIVPLAATIGKRLNLPVEKLNYTLPATREAMNTFDKADLVIWGAPVYAGRIPSKLLPYVQSHFIGNDALTVPITVFGNYSFGDVLIELRDVLEINGFHTVAGTGVATQHAFSTALAASRPDQIDMEEVEEFATRMAERVGTLKTLPQPIDVKGTNPPGVYYTPEGLNGKPTVFLRVKSKTDMEKCNHCDICIRRCPMGSINSNDPSNIIGIYIRCHAYVKWYPQDARYSDDEQFTSHKLVLERNFAQRVKPLFLI